MNSASLATVISLVSAGMQLGNQRESFQALRDRTHNVYFPLRKEVDVLWRRILKRGVPQSDMTRLTSLIENMEKHLNDYKKSLIIANEQIIEAMKIKKDHRIMNILHEASQKLLRFKDAGFYHIQLQTFIVNLLYIAFVLYMVLNKKTATIQVSGDLKERIQSILSKSRQYGEEHTWYNLDDLDSSMTDSDSNPDSSPPSAANASEALLPEEPFSPDALEPSSPAASKPSSPDASEPSSPDASEPLSPLSPRPSSQDASESSPLNTASDFLRYDV